MPTLDEMRAMALDLRAKTTPRPLGGCRFCGGAVMDNDPMALQFTHTGALAHVACIADSLLGKLAEDGWTIQPPATVQPPTE